ncbi:MAG: LysR family transcriptional regulator [Pseudomonadota bacterium]
MELSSQMILFARVVEQGSFSAAARVMRHSPSAVSKQIAALEDRLGVRLVTRTQQGIALTQEGRVFYDRCADIASTVTETETLLESMATHPRGVLRVNATVAFGKAQIMPLLPQFLARYPDISVALELTDRAMDIFAEDTDVGIRFSEQIDNTSVIARKLATNRRVICAAPSYLAAHGTPERPQDLAAHNCLRLSTVEKWNEWRFGEGAGARSVPVTGNFEANSADAVYHAALAGLGIARLSTYLVHQDIATGRLVRLLPDYIHSASSIYAIYPERRNLAPKIRAFLDFLTEAFAKTAPWERASVT